MKPSQYFHTLRHLKAEQFAFRALHFAQSQLRARAPRLAAMGTAAPCHPRWTATLRAQAAARPDLERAREEVQAFLDGSFDFVGERASARSPIDWKPPGRSRLFRYHLHYLDVLRPLSALVLRGDTGAYSRGQALIDEWSSAHPLPRGEGWDPYPTSLRLVNIAVFAAASGTGASMAPLVHAHARWVSRNLERHLLGNHLLKNLKALVFAGLWLGCRHSRRWRRQGEARLRVELSEQVLSDGGHFERSPMYHQIVFEDLLDLVGAYRLVSEPPPAFLTEAASRMRDFTAAVRHPDGEIPLLNDSAIGQAASPSELLALAAGVLPAGGAGTGWRRALWTGSAGQPEAVSPPPIGLIEKGDFGLFVVRERPATLFFDVGPIGPDHLAGHAHSDSLTFELSLDGERLIVDGGLSGYEGDPFRAYLRSTRAHNTVEVDGANSDEVWATFRVARRSRVGGRSALRVGKAIVLTGTSRAPAGWVHTRTLCLWPEDGLLILDRISVPVGGKVGGAVARVHFAPLWTRETSTRLASATRRVEVFGATDWVRGATQPPEGWAARRFGKPEPVWTARTSLAPAANGLRSAVLVAWSSDATLTADADVLQVRLKSGSYIVHRGHAADILSGEL